MKDDFTSLSDEYRKAMKAVWDKEILAYPKSWTDPTIRPSSRDLALCVGGPLDEREMPYGPYHLAIDGTYHFSWVTETGEWQTHSYHRSMETGEFLWVKRV